MVSQAKMNISEQFKRLFAGQTLEEQQGNDPAQLRRLAALKTRGDAALIAFQRPLPEQRPNGEEMDYRGDDGQPNFIANFTKGLPRQHYRDPDPKKNLGEVDPNAYKAFLKALKTAQPEDFEAIPLGSGRKFVNPQAGLAFTLEAPDAQAVTVPPAPRIDRRERSGVKNCLVPEVVCASTVATGSLWRTDSQSSDGSSQLPDRPRNLEFQRA